MAESNKVKIENSNISTERLLVYQQDLQHEEECLKNIIAKLDEQIHALQVCTITYLVYIF